MGAFEGEQLVVKAVEPGADFLAKNTGALVKGVYFFHSRKSMEQHGWRCREVPDEQAAGDSSPQVSFARGDAPGREPGARL